MKGFDVALGLLFVAMAVVSRMGYFDGLGVLGFGVIETMVFIIGVLYILAGLIKRRPAFLQGV